MTDDPGAHLWRDTPRRGESMTAWGARMRVQHREHFEAWFTGEFGDAFDVAWPNVDRAYLREMYTAAFNVHLLERAWRGIACPHGFTHWRPGNGMWMW